MKATNHITTAKANVVPVIRQSNEIAKKGNNKVLN